MDTILTPELDADLERRVAERTAQLAAANEQLQTQIVERKRAEAALRESRQLLERTLYSLQDAAFVLDAKTVEIMDCNPAASQMFGYHRDDMLGRTTDFLHVDRTALEEFRTHLYSAVQDLGSLRALEFNMKRVDGTIFPTEHSVTPLTDERGNRTGWVSVVRDITERKRAEERIRREAARTGALLRVARVLMLNSQLDLENVIRTVCEETRRVMNVPIALVALFDETQDVFQFAGGAGVPADWAARVQPVPRNFFEEHLKTTGPLIVIPDAQAVPGLPNAEFFQALNIRTHVIVTMLLDGRPIGNLRVATVDQVRTFDEDEMQLLQGLADQAALAIRNARLFQSVSEQRKQLVEVQETERQRLAWEIHDDVSQSLTALIMQVGAVRGLLPKASDRAETILEGAEALAKTTLEGVRRMIAGLRPPVLDDFGLIPTLRRLGDELREDAGVDVAVEASSLSDRLPPPLETALFRIVQEALTNIRKHAHARRASISLAVERERVMLLVKDDGVGLNFRRDQPRRRGDVRISGGWVVPAGHYGLVGIQERAALLGGTARVQSAPGEGTTLRVELPR